MLESTPPAPADTPVEAIVGERLTRAAFSQLAGNLAGYPFIKLVVDRPNQTIHFINDAVHPMHGYYIAARMLGIEKAELEADIDKFNHRFYSDPDRDLYLGILSLHTRDDRTFFALETVEIDTMDAEMLQFFYRFVRENVDPAIPVLLKPANHFQEGVVADLDPTAVPRLMAHELFSTAPFIPLHPGTSQGRLRVFLSERAYRAARDEIEWFDIVVMSKVPDDIPRLSGIINASHTTPLSHTNVLATGWQIPNCIQTGILARIADEGLDGEWVEYTVSPDAQAVSLTRIEKPAHAGRRPAWRSLRVVLESPETSRTPIARLDELRMGDRYKYGTKAANLGELMHVLAEGSDRLSGFYRVKRPPRKNLLPQLGRLLGAAPDADVEREAWGFLREWVRVPNGIAIPFAFQREFLEASPRIQQAIGKLKMALELDARQVDSICVGLQQEIRRTRIPPNIRGYIDSQIARNMAGTASFVVRSSSNAEDLENFSAAGIYESVTHVTRAESLFEGVKQVWASLLSPRSVRLRQDVGISLEDSYMGVIIQEEVSSSLGGVLVTANPLKREDVRNVYINLTRGSVASVVDGTAQPFQYLYNIIEGGGRTLSIGEADADLDEASKAQLQRIAVAGRLLQAHFSPDYTFSAPIDMEWVADADEIHVLQLRPYAW